MRRRTEYIRKECVPKVRRHIATHKRFKQLIDQWIDLDIERSKLIVQTVELGANP